MGIARDSLRKEAKKAYKEQIKNVPKKQRIPKEDIIKFMEENFQTNFI